MSDDRERMPTRGYGNIYTPRAGSMVIQVQRESTLANRTIVLSQRQVRLFRTALHVAAAALVLGTLSWFYLAAQAARVPLLTRKLALLQHDAQRIDTLQAALHELDGRFRQVQHMLGAGSAASGRGAPATDTLAASVPDTWPLPIAGELLPQLATGHGINVAVPSGTPIRASGAGMVVEIREDAASQKLVRITHRDGYETIYSNAGGVRVAQGDRVAAGAMIAATGDATSSLPPHLHFEVRRGGVDVDPSSIMKKGPIHGDLQ